MILVIDVGNTCIKWSMVEGQLLAEVCVVRHDGDINALIAHPAWRQLSRPARILVSNVIGGSFAASLTKWVAAHWARELEFVMTAEDTCGIRHCYHDINRLGVDRWVSLVAAHKQWPGATCICDCGTALTIDFLAADGKHQGGLILPGREMMRKSLCEASAAIELGADECAEQTTLSLCAGDTASAVMQGTLYALVATISRVVADARTLSAEPMRAVITGGDALRLLPFLDGELEYHPNLVLQGLAVIAGEDT